MAVMLLVELCKRGLYIVLLSFMGAFNNLRKMAQASTVKRLRYLKACLLPPRSMV